MRLSQLASAACSVTFAVATLYVPALAQSAGGMGGMQADSGAKKPLPSPPATASVTLAGKQVTVKYSAPSMRGRKVMGALVPYGTIWRTGANAATTLITATNLKIGTLNVPAGTYTLYTLPSAAQWLLIVNRQTGQWGTVYNMSQDLGRTAMTSKTLTAPQETMSISFENTQGKTTQLHVKWDTTDEYVTVAAQ